MNSTDLITILGEAAIHLAAAGADLGDLADVVAALEVAAPGALAAAGVELQARHPHPGSVTLPGSTVPRLASSTPRK